MLRFEHGFDEASLGSLVVLSLPNYGVDIASLRRQGQQSAPADLTLPKTIENLIYET